MEKLIPANQAEEMITEAAAFGICPEEEACLFRIVSEAGYSEEVIASWYGKSVAYVGRRIEVAATL